MTQMAHAMRGNSGNRTSGTDAPFFDGTQPCREIGSELFFPEDAAEALKLKALVKPICRSCQFSSPCLKWALENYEVGIWSGTTDSERQRIRRKKKS